MRALAFMPCVGFPYTTPPSLSLPFYRHIKRYLLNNTTMRDKSVVFFRGEREKSAKTTEAGLYHLTPWRGAGDEVLMRWHGVGGCKPGKR